MSSLNGSLAKSLNLLPPVTESKLSGVQNDFWKRVRSFINEQKWLKKPLSLSPVECARYGWKCLNSNMLECVTCCAKLNSSLPKTENIDTYNACVQKIQECLKTAHKKHCPWPLSPCPAHFSQIFPVHKEEAFQQFITRLESLILLKDLLPEINKEISEKLGITEQHLTSLCNLTHIDVNNCSFSAVLLASTGWFKSSEVEQSKCIVCHDCQRIVSLILYSSGEKYTLVNKTVVTAEEKDASASDSTQQPHTCSDQCEETELNSTTQNDLLTKDNENKSSNERNETCNKRRNNSSEIVLSTTSSSEINEQDEDLPPAKRLKISAVESNHSCETVEKSNSSQCDIKEELRKKIKVPFDPLYEHRPWCRWVTPCKIIVDDHSKKNMPSQADMCVVSPLPGWKLFMSCLLRNISLSDSSSDAITSPTKEQLSHARSMLESWTSPI